MGMLARLMALIIVPAVAHAATYHVRPDGNDGNAGTGNAANQAWLTVQHAANTMVAGDTVRVHEGSYPERVDQATSGAEGQNITYVADGNVVLLGFNITGAYVRVVGFEITHPSDVGYAGIRISDAAWVQVWDCNIHNTSQASIHPSGTPHLLVRGNIMNYSGSPGDNNGPGMKSIYDSGPRYTDALFDYNEMSHTTDYMNSNGDRIIFRNNVLGPSLTTDFGGTPHVDGWQANTESHYGFMEANWHINNSVSDSHMILIEAPVSGESSHFVVMKNVSLRSGDQLWYQMRDGDNLHAAHNTVGQVGFGPRGGPGSSGFFYIWDGSINNVARNNIYREVTTGRLYEITTGGAITHDHDLTDVGTDVVDGVNGDRLGVDPLFVNYAQDDVMVQPGSPAIDAGGALTTVTSPSGSGTSFVVANPDWFHDGFGLAVGHSISVGDDNNLQVTAVDYNTGTLTVSVPITWVSGDAVGYAYRGTGPDLGAYEYGDARLSGVTLAAQGDTYTATPEGDARFVVFYQDGVPLQRVNTAPFTANIAGGGVMVKAYALHAQADPVVSAATGSGGSSSSATSSTSSASSGGSSTSMLSSGSTAAASSSSSGAGGGSSAGEDPQEDAGRCGCQAAGQVNAMPPGLLMVVLLGVRRVRRWLMRISPRSRK